ncbi:MAG: putative M18 family aminopeptidase 2 [Acidimicrobiales bacterium AG-410-I20]|nr:MAG: putative M18 family aminopeptidase 2 [Acidimicrobiales bacterium AG-410-I20]
MIGTGKQAALDLCDFIDSSPSPFHAVNSAAERLLEAGFSETGSLSTLKDKHLVFFRRDGALIAVNRPKNAAKAVRVVGAHTDSPNLRLKPIVESNKNGWRSLGVETYGSILNNSWLDRDLGCSGRLVLKSKDNFIEKVCRLDKPIARIPQLAIHLDREVNEKGLVLNRQDHMQPVIGIEDGLGLLERLAETADVDVKDVLSFDLMLHDLTPSTLSGINEEFISAPRIDNLFSCHAAVDSLISASNSGSDFVQMVMLYDHEEIGSTSSTGAMGPLLKKTLDICSDDSTLFAEKSLMISADCAHGTHPNYPERHDANHQVRLNHGPVLKHNANVRYATDGLGAALVKLAAEKTSVPLQTFVSRSDMPCGSTIGPLAAASTGIRTVDLGAPQLAMHSIREMCGSEDPAYLASLLTNLLQE